MLHSRRAFWVLLLLTLIVALAVVAVPLYVIRPFRPQSPGELQLALAIRRAAPLTATLAAGVSLALGVFFWKRLSGVWTRLTAAFVVLLTVGAAVFSHINIFEMMFHPVDSVSVMPAKDAKLESDDMVLAVSFSGTSRAYPIRMMAYHHLVNDRIGELAIVATY